MILCLCRGVSDRVIRRAVREGADSVREIARTTRACTGCGSCRVDLEKILDQERSTELPIAAK